jgi:hypothetical protein
MLLEINPEHFVNTDYIINLLFKEKKDGMFMIIAVMISGEPLLIAEIMDKQQGLDKFNKLINKINASKKN